jgi:hypothetical protein
MVMDFFLLCYIIAAAIIWFDTEAIPEYLSVFGFKFHRYDEWMAENSAGRTSFDYQTYILAKYNNFFVRLVTCPLCVIVWFNLLTLPVLPLKMLGAQLLASWLGYFSVSNLVKKLNE